MKTLLILLVALAAFSCGEDECKRYADYELKCFDWPADELEITRQLAEGLCKMAKEGGHTGVEKEIADDTLREVRCAKSAKSCEDYRRCKQASN